MPDHLKAFSAIPNNQYPLFNKYPKLVIDYQIQERERILLSEAEIERSKRYHDELKQMNSQLQQEHEMWITKQRAMLEAEEMRKKETWDREKQLLEEKLSLQNLTREQQLNHIQLLHANTKKFYEEMEQIKENEFKKLKADLERKLLKEQMILNDVIEEQKYKKVQADLELKYNEVLLKKELEKHVSSMKQEIELENKQSELEIQKKKDIILHNTKEKEVKEMVCFFVKISYLVTYISLKITRKC